MSDLNYSELFITIIIVAFIGGCTYTISHGGSSNLQMNDCLRAGYNWQDGDCVK